MRTMPLPTRRTRFLDGSRHSFALLALALVVATALISDDVHAQRRSPRAAVMRLVQAEQLFAQAKRAAEDLGRVEIRPGDANGQLRAWDRQWSRFVAGLDALSTSATCGDFGEDVECSRRAVEALMCGLNHDLELARGAVFYDEALQGALRDLPWKIAARRAVANEAMRRESAHLSCEDVESIWDAQRRLAAEERRARSQEPASDDADPNATDDASRDSLAPGDATRQSTPAPAPRAPTATPTTLPSSSSDMSSAGTPMTLEQAERAVRDLIAAIEDLDVVLVDGVRATRRRSVADALLLFAAVEAWRTRWPNFGQNVAQLNSTGCTVPDPLRTLTCEIGADLVRWSTESQSAGTDRNPVRTFERAHASTRRLLDVLRSRLRRANEFARERSRDPMSRLLTGG